MAASTAKRSRLVIDLTGDADDELLNGSSTCDGSNQFTTVPLSDTFRPSPVLASVDPPAKRVKLNDHQKIATASGDVLLAYANVAAQNAARFDASIRETVLRDKVSNNHTECSYSTRLLGAHGREASHSGRRSKDWFG